jgi:hypothetical protein
VRNLKSVKSENSDIVELINELTSLKPNQIQIKKYCESVGIAYKKNVIDLMSDILLLSSPQINNQINKSNEATTLNKILNKEI